MKVILEIDDKYAGVLSITAVGVCGFDTNVSTYAVDITKHNYITVDKNAHWTNGRIDNV
mgnify:CR=1 FL=1